MAYFDNDFDNLFNELNSSFFNDDFGSRRNSKGNSGSIPINYSSSMGAAPQTIQQNPQQPNEKPIGVDLVEEAKNNKFDPVIGRDEQIDNVIEILSRRKKNNPVLIGPAGVGKTSIVEGLAERIASGNVPAKMANMHIISVNINDMVAGSSLRGSFEERLKKVIDKAKSDPNIVLFIDEIHNIVGAGSTDSENNNGDAANILKPALASGQLKLIGATTTSEFQRIEKDPALSRRFQAVQVPEPTTKVAVKILEGLKKKYEDYHHVKYSDDSLKLAVELSERYIQGRYLPDKAIDLMDEAGAKKALLVQPTDEKSLKNQISALEAKKAEAAKAEDYDKASEIKSKIAELEAQLKNVDSKNTPEVTEKDIYAIIEQKTKIPMSELHADEAQKNLDLAKKLKKNVIDQDRAIDVITDAIARKQIFKDSDRPTGSFLLTGPTGVGKTELAKQLAIQLFGNKEHLIRLDMSEYQDEMAVNKLIGSAPGYVGYGEGGQLTEKVRHQPYSLILFDEIEKANPQVFNALLQIMDDGRLTDAQGRTVSFKDTILIMTSNAGFSDKLLEDGKVDQDKLISALENYFRPEFLNRLDAIVPFNSLTEQDMGKIINIYLKNMSHVLGKKGVSVEVSDEAKAFLAEKGYDKKFGARPLRRVVEQNLETPAAKLIMQKPEIKKLEFTADDKHLYLNGEAIFDISPKIEEKVKEDEAKAEDKKED
ncbi:MAG: ATP-dependent Clp protease ATP-binding subunit [Lactobacillus crispatus]|jgi:ATP-dependent Clp protease ATP-binding subunit ClpE|uniref:ATP-dependent Clp protease ATP-binding subunit n=1 Tax=Lactobacillus crispatus TaxID=47770 RepID=UPI0018A8FA03|nr:ATP-dependent Clp protease ATP-binding subunit [Lactobacillus crispatus]MCH4003492.1 ATP-dependent Clp protease ATP-binding subunit [Lactobacillus crispatus]MCI1336631.1 ATP-dependent Clp protease ATP-binding subunit [Lactobacillus crispatus]MCI1366189.1 ATP-dependent Clp protease ATP-binding subunit [Lactobacillus crispatus]MCI1494553.1 ATP-dependent Clp protease ATP-binding subunit [Lactobacillus crispatus]MCI1524640.1 ATP-dependent Clp protease ATP-binding subunit [Lactobacillus crispatu